MNWLIPILIFYFYLFFLGIIFFPTTKKLFFRFSFDLGYPFSKTIGLILTSYLIYLLATLKILSFGKNNLILILSLFFLFNFFIIKIKLKKIKYLIYSNIIIEEILFLISFVFWAFIRSQEPSIQSLEKFMDFGFINSILRTKFFPPADIWYPPEPINYYYFGHLTGATLIKLTSITPTIGYNLILASIFALGITQIFSLICNIIFYFFKKINYLNLIIYGLIGAFIINLGGNLHTIYLFTKGYPNDNPIPFWKILSGYNPQTYWYPNATRFIPYTIHEFPSYSYVVADLHGHVFDIPFVMLTFALLFLIFTYKEKINDFIKLKINLFKKNLILNINQYYLFLTTILGFLISVHYMTNAFDGPIYFLLTLFIFLFIFNLSTNFFFYFFLLITSFFIFNLPYSSHFQPFVSGIGVNCSPNFLTKIGKLGPFLFETGNCQVSPIWMLLVLWGFFWLNFIIFLILIYKNLINININLKTFLILIFSFGTLLIIIPEFFYIKDIYPQHFRANTMFKLGYQAFIIMGVSSTIVLFLIKNIKKKLLKFSFLLVYFPFLILVVIYPYYAIPSYYGKLDKTPNLDGSNWLKTFRPEDKEIIDYLNNNIQGQPVILEAQGDSYTDYERISAFTGLPTVAGWWVHEWLWRGSPDYIGQRIPDVVNLYESRNINLTKKLIEKYNIKYVIISRLEKEKYPNLNEEKFLQLGKLIFQSSNGFGAIYKLN